MSGLNRNESAAGPARLAQLTRWATQPPRPRTSRLASAASLRHGLDAPRFETELGARCHVCAMSVLVNRLTDGMRP